MHAPIRKFGLVLSLAPICALLACSQEPAGDGDTLAIIAIPVPTESARLGSNLAQGPDGTTVLSWIERGAENDSLRYARFADGKWSAANTVVSGDNWFVNWADFPSVVPISESLWGAHWLVRRSAGGYAYDAYSAVSSDGGRSWSSAATLHQDGTDTEHGFVTLFPQGDDVGALWLDGRNMVNEVGPDPTGSGMTLRAATLTSNGGRHKQQLVDELVCDCCQTDVAISSRGPVAVYRDRSVDELRDIYVTRLVDGAWQAGTPVNNDSWNIAGCPVNGPVINAHGNNVIVAWFTAAGDTPQVRIARSTDAGRHFSDPVDVMKDGTLGRVSAAMLDADNAVVGWLSDSTGGAANLQLRLVARDGQLGPMHTVADDVAAFSVPQMTTVNGQLLLAWTASQNDQTRIRSALISLDELID